MRLKFNELPRAVRERIVQLTHADGKDPRILHFTTHWGGGWFRWLMLIGGVVAAGLCVNFLVERARDHVHPRHDQEIFLGLAAAMFVVSVAGVGTLYRFLWPPPPYRLGLWAFGSGLMRTDGGWIDFTPATELPRPTLVTVRRNGSYSHSRLELGGPFSFYFPSNAAAEKVCDAILTAKARMVAFVAARDAQAIATVDPFAECTLSGRWSEPASSAIAPEGPTAAIVPGVARAVQWVGGLVLGLAVAGGAYAVFSMTFTPG